MNSMSQFLWLDITLPLNRTIRPGYSGCHGPASALVFSSLFSMLHFGKTDRLNEQSACWAYAKAVPRRTGITEQAAGYRTRTLRTPSQFLSVRYNPLRGGGHWFFSSTVVH
ncbi:hypothetical protein N7517_008186 [Penicillium concentricum]|uniref:Uncharacterized protein n=1 Tax=Penicillium concentricum TaxID=293559 RepID=A0A9W9RRY6_9EURO|nr:uncharacterized protein N7517_008186 [Penicillium concentricum]KAJ5365300.1 hypothetical protein N7517_008186 [Penicillium concentricum]